MAPSTYDRVWDLVQKEFVARCATLPTVDFEVNPQGVSTIPNDLLLRMVIGGLLVRIKNLEEDK